LLHLTYLTVQRFQLPVYIYCHFHAFLSHKARPLFRVRQFWQWTAQLNMSHRNRECYEQFVPFFLHTCLPQINLYMLMNYYTTTTHDTLNGLFYRTTCASRYQKSKTSLILNEARDDGVLGCSGISWTICTSLQTDNHINTPSLNFYRPDALPDAQSTVSKHCR